jgi:hypothetical protein
VWGVIRLAAQRLIERGVSDRSLSPVGAVQRRLARMPRFQSIDRAVAADAVRIVFCFGFRRSCRSTC